MTTSFIEVPDELLRLLRDTRLGERPPATQVQIALAIHLFLDGVISVGKAAELAGEPRFEFERLLAEMGLPAARYDTADYDEDLRGIAGLGPPSPTP
jgi:predicted HTH domain antitoxin